MRNVVLHQGADVLDWIFIPVSTLGTIKMGSTTPPHQEWMWPLSETFTPPDGKTGKCAYRSLLAGKDVPATLEQAHSEPRGLGI